MGKLEFKGNVGDSNTESFKLELDKGVIHLELFLMEPERQWDWDAFCEKVGEYAQRLLKR